VNKKCVSAVVVALCGLATTAVAAPIPVTDTPVPDRDAVLLSNGLVPLDMSGTAVGASMTGANNNTYSVPFVGPFGNYAGTLSVEVFGNTSVPGPGLNDVVLVYTFIGDFAANPIESFHFGIDSSLELDIADIVGPGVTHGRVDADSTPGQLSPGVTVFDNGGANDTWFFDYGATDTLGGGSSETLTWYMRTGGDIKLNFVPVEVLDFGGVTIDTLAPIINPNQPDLDVPAPGALALMGLAGLAAARRRRK
jgi:MYXO-CTERM domain-containing protein